jgi:DNA-binding transcriptional MerR regulator
MCYIFGEVAMSEKRYSVGEVAVMTGLTVRTLQYYDNIGLLPAVKDTESGRRYYPETSLINLEQILFYKALGFSLNDIRENLSTSTNPSELRIIFEKQKTLLLRKMERLQTTLATIDASIKVLDAGSKPPFEMTLQFLSILPGDDVFEWAPALLDADQKTGLSKTFRAFDEAQGFYHLLKSMLIDALVLFHAHIPPTHPQAQQLAQRWQEMLAAVAADDPGILEQFVKIGENQQFGFSRNQILVDDVFRYIEAAVENLVSKRRHGFSG